MNGLIRRGRCALGLALGVGLVVLAGSARAHADASDDVAARRAAVAEALRSAQRLPVRPHELMRGVKPPRDLRTDPGHELHGQLLSALGVVLQELVEAKAVDIVHDEEGALVVFPDIENTHDVAVPNHPCKARLVEEHAPHLLVVTQRVQQSLARVEALEVTFPSHDDGDLRHASPRQRANRRVAARPRLRARPRVGFMPPMIVGRHHPATLFSL